MKRVLNVAGALLMLGGVGVLIYAGVSYLRARPAATASHTWNSSQRHKGKELARLLSGHQRIAVPTGAHLPPAGTEPAVRIVIPKIGVDAPVTETAPTNGIWQVADWAVGHLSVTPNPGAPGNDALSAHDDVKGEIFKRLGELGPGDVIQLYTRHAMYRYVVTGQVTVDPSDVAVLNPTKAATVTLISCTPYWVDTQRLVVQGVLKARVAV